MEPTAVPPGDRGEQLVANLILSSIAYQFDAVASARAYAAQARDIAVTNQASRVDVVRVGPDFATAVRGRCGPTKLDLEIGVLGPCAASLNLYFILVLDLRTC